MDNKLKGMAVRNLRLPTTDYNATPIQITPAQQGDINSRILKVQLYDNRGNIDLSVYSTALLSAIRIDGELFVAECEIEDGFIYCTLTPPMLAERGKVTCDITLTGKNLSGNDTILTSQTFYIYVARSQLVDNDLIGSDNFNILISLINNVKETEKMIRLLESGIHDAEGLRVIAENERQVNEAERQKNFNKVLSDVSDAVDTVQSITYDIANTASQAVAIANAAVSTATEAVSLSASAIASSANAEAVANMAVENTNNAVKVAQELKAQAEQSALSALQAEAAANAIATQVYATANGAVEIASDAKAKAQSVVDRANSGEFKGEQGLQGESGYLLPIPNNFFRAEVRADGNLWIVSPSDATNPFSIKDGNLIFTIQ